MCTRGCMCVSACVRVSIHVSPVDYSNVKLDRLRRKDQAGCHQDLAKDMAFGRGPGDSVIDLSIQVSNLSS